MTETCWLKCYLDRCDQFVTHRTRTHLTSNRNAPELETLYGNRLRSRIFCHYAPKRLKSHSLQAGSTNSS